MGGLFFLLILLFIITAINNTTFFNWAYERHKNPLSWYIRPILLIPFCYFAYKKRWSGVMFSLFCLFTSMFWFNKPEAVSEQVEMFLEFEKLWLHSEMNTAKLIQLSLIPISIFLLGYAFWKRSLWIGVLLLACIAFGKIVWGIYNTGNSGTSIILPAMTGLILCLGFVIYKKLKP